MKWSRNGEKSKKGRAERRGGAVSRITPKGGDPDEQLALGGVSYLCFAFKNTYQ